MRRDISLRKHGISILLTCTYRDERESAQLGVRGKTKISRLPSEAFEVVVLKHGRIYFMDKAIEDHAKAVGLVYEDDGRTFSKDG
jgi:hypothetical protein